MDPAAAAAAAAAAATAAAGRRLVWPGLAPTSGGTLTSTPSPSPPFQSYAAAAAAAAAVPTHPGVGGQPVTVNLAQHVGGGQGTSPQETAKALRAKLERLKAAKVALGGAAACADTASRIDDDIASAQAQLGACLPVEVAVKGTIAPAAQARQAVGRSEAKLAKLEGHIAALMAAHDVATAELADNRAKLVEAEAATARAAAVALPRSDIDAALASDPAAVWAALMGYIKVRVPGMPAAFVAQLGAATDAFQAACAQLPAAPAAGAAAPAQPTADQPPPAAPQQPALLQPSSPTVPSHFEAAVAAAETSHAAVAEAAAALQQLHQRQQSAEEAAAAAAAALAAGPSQLPAAGGPVTAGSDAVEVVPLLARDEATLLRLQQAEAQRDWQHHLSASGAAVAPTSGGVGGVHALAHGSPNPGGDPANGGAGAGAPHLAAALDDDNDLDLVAAAPRNDPMGGGATDTIVGKRGAEAVSDVLDRARGVAAKAKAKAAAA